MNADPNALAKPVIAVAFTNCWYTLVSGGVAEGETVADGVGDVMEPHMASMKTFLFCIVDKHINWICHGSQALLTRPGQPSPKKEALAGMMQLFFRMHVL